MALSHNKILEASYYFMKLFKISFLLILCILLCACKDAHDLELQDIKHPDQDTIFFNVYQNVYSEDKTLQPVWVGTCLTSECKGEHMIINVPRVYFYSTIRPEDDRSFIEKQFQNIPRNNWPAISTTEALTLLLSCKDGTCTSYPETCDKGKLICAKPLRQRLKTFPTYLNLVEIDFLFHEQKGPFSLFNPRFVWVKKDLIETLPGGYERHEAHNTSKITKKYGGIYYPASKADKFHSIQCRYRVSGCEYLFYLPLDEDFANNLYGDKNKQLLVKATFENLRNLDNDFAEVNKRLTAIQKGLCKFMPCQ